MHTIIIFYTNKAEIEQSSFYQAYKDSTKVKHQNFVQKS